jgi:DNA-binding Xre family transcriptional regulator
MLKLQIKELCKLRGIKAPTVAISKTGITHSVAFQFLKGNKKHLTLDHIEKLCTLLRCTPNDLFAWTPNNTAEDYPENPLQKIREQSMPDLQSIIGNLSLEEVKKRLEGK